MWNVQILYFIFLGQVLAGCYFLPREIYRKALDAIDRHPPLQYPKLYPGYYSEKVLKKALGFYRLCNIGVMFLGFMIVGHGIVSGSNELLNWDDQGVIIVYQFFQGAPLLVFAFLSFSYYKMMRHMNIGTKRSASIQRRKLTDHISLIVIGFALINLAVYVLLVFAINRDPFDGFAGIFPNLLGAIFLNGMTAAVIIQRLYGKKQNPHQAVSDRNKETHVVIKLAVFVSVFGTAYMSINLLLGWLDMRAIGDVIQSGYSMTIFLSLWFFMTQMKEINFEVYKANPTVKKNMCTEV